MIFLILEGLSPLRWHSFTVWQSMSSVRRQNDVVMTEFHRRSIPTPAAHQRIHLVFCENISTRVNIKSFVIQKTSPCLRKWYHDVIYIYIPFPRSRLLHSSTYYWIMLLLMWYCFAVLYSMVECCIVWGSLMKNKWDFAIWSASSCQIPYYLYVFSASYYSNILYISFTTCIILYVIICRLPPVE